MWLCNIGNIVTYIGLSKWVRQGIKHYTEYYSAKLSLKRFAEERLFTTAVNTTSMTSPPNFMYEELSLHDECFINLLFTSRSTCCDVAGTTTMGIPSLQSPPFTPRFVTDASPPKEISPLPAPPVFSMTQQMALRDRQLTGFISDELRVTGLQSFNSNNIQLPVHTSPLVAKPQQDSSTMHAAEVKTELNETLTIPASPPMYVSFYDDDTVDQSQCDTPPLFDSPVKQPVTSTQVDADCEMAGEINHLPGSHPAEALNITENVKLEQHNSVVSSSSQQIVLPSNPTSCSQMDSMMTTSVIGPSSPEQQYNLRKRNGKDQITNIRYAKRRHHGKQQV